MVEVGSDSLGGLPEEKAFYDAQEFVAFIASGLLRSSRWVFRGQPNAGWKLQPSLERFASELAQPRMVASIEGHHLHEFRRRARYYTEIVPEHGNLLEWLALMRHHGSPSRLLDFSKSPYVAAFFATAEAGRNDAVAIWAIDARALKRRSAQVLSRELCIDYVEIGKRCLADPTFPLTEPKTFSSLIGGLGPKALVARMGPIPRAVFAIEPHSMNERMLLQQGLFLFPTSLECSFHESLQSVLALPSEGAGADPSRTERVFYKLVLQPSAHPHVLRELHRMGLNYATLTPGLDGLGRSLATVSKIRATCIPPGLGPDWDFDTACE